MIVVEGGLKWVVDQGSVSRWMVDQSADCPEATKPATARLVDVGV